MSVIIYTDRAVLADDLSSLNRSGDRVQLGYTFDNGKHVKLDPMSASDAATALNAAIDTADVLGMTIDRFNLWVMGLR